MSNARCGIALCLLLPLAVVAQADSVSRTKLPSELAFDDLMARVGLLPPDERNYEEIVSELVEIVQDYPNSPGAELAVDTASLWNQKGLISSGLAQSVFDEAALQYQSFAEVSEALEDIEEAKDPQRARETLSRLSEIADQNVGTYSGYLASMNLIELYKEAGDDTAAFAESREFFARYPLGATDFTISESRLWDLILLDAELTVLVASPAEGIARYEEIADYYSGVKIYDLPALWSAGETAIEAGLNDEAIRIFKKLTARYDYEDESRVIVAKFRIAEAFMRKGDFATARQAFTALQTEFRDTAYAQEASGWLEHLADTEARKQGMEASVPSDGANIPQTPRGDTDSLALEKVAVIAHPAKSRPDMAIEPETEADFSVTTPAYSIVGSMVLGSILLGAGLVVWRVTTKSRAS